MMDQAEAAVNAVSRRGEKTRRIVAPGLTPGHVLLFVFRREVRCVVYRGVNPTIVSLYLPMPLRDRLDRMARRAGVSRSRFVRQLVERAEMAADGLAAGAAGRAGR